MKIIGAVLILAACGYVGFAMAAAYRREENALQQLILVLEYVQNELSFRMPPLPELCILAAQKSDGILRDVFNQLSQKLEKQETSDASLCMASVLDALPPMPPTVRANLSLVGASLGRFDLSGQLSGLETAKTLCSRDLEGLRSHHDERIRSYRTLALCAGAALVILFI